MNAHQSGAIVSAHHNGPSTQSANNTKTLVDMISDFNTRRSTQPSGINYELEIRLHGMNREIFAELAKMANESSTVHHTADLIVEKIQGAKDFSKQVYTVTYLGDERLESYWRKESLRQPIVSKAYIGYKVSLSRETSISAFPHTDGSFLRLKNRMSTVIGPWRLDLTVTKQGPLKNYARGLADMRKKFFPRAVAAGWVDTLPYDMVDQFEAELEYVGKEELTMNHFDVVHKIFQVINPKYTDEVTYQQAIYAIAELLYDPAEAKRFLSPQNRLKQLANQVVSLSLNSYHDEVFPPTGMYLTDKADGTRVICDMRTVGDTVTLSIVGGSIWQHVIQLAGAPARICCDAEMVNETVYVFDVITDGGVRATDPFEKRVAAIDGVCAALNGLKSQWKFVAKKYVVLQEGQFEKQFREVWERPMDYELDGLILTGIGEGYLTTKNYKWKPYSHNTIDFLAVRCPKVLLGTAPYIVKPGAELYLLFVGISHQRREKMGIGLIPYYKQLFPALTDSYYPVQFSPSVNPVAYLYWHVGDVEIDRQIVELSRDRSNRDWIFHRVRSDRALEKGYYGNDFRVATLTYMNYIDAFEFEHLWQVGDKYFMTSTDHTWHAGNKFRRFTISLLMRNHFSGKRWIVDLASGRGADTHRYQEIHVENALFVDVDKAAIAELVRRWVSSKQNARKHVKTWLGSNEGTIVVDRVQADGTVQKRLVDKLNGNLTVWALVADLMQPHADTLRMMEPFGVYPGVVDGIVCNFALHYFCRDQASLLNFLQMVSALLRPKDVFLFTVMDGERVHELVGAEPVGYRWRVVEGGVEKYAIEKKYAGKKLLGVGQTIAVRVPFAEEMYEEPLCNVTHVVSVAKKCGLVLEQREPMTAFLPQFMKGDKTLYDRMSEDDRMYSSLHTYVTLRKA